MTRPRTVWPGPSRNSTGARPGIDPHRLDLRGEPGTLDGDWGLAWRGIVDPEIPRPVRLGRARRRVVPTSHPDVGPGDRAAITIENATRDAEPSAENDHGRLLSKSVLRFARLVVHRIHLLEELRVIKREMELFKVNPGRYEIGMPSPLRVGLDLRIVEDELFPAGAATR